MSWNYWETGTNYSQMDARELKEKSEQTIKKERGKGKTMEPVIVAKGARQIAQSWWGKAWCENLERYADYESRIERGRRYVRSNTVVDLKIQKGKVTARVQGSRRTPYKVEIHISPLSEERCQETIALCGRRIENLEQLLQGNFPEDLKELFLGEKGLFPEPKEISFSCSCPDWALMCKHVAAALYGIAVRFDENPLLFFELRGIDVERFIDVTIANRVESMLEHADVESARVMDGEDWASLFGLD